jgi:tetratricopeptide (TPR) repeat protein
MRPPSPTRRIRSKRSRRDLRSCWLACLAISLSCVGGDLRSVPEATDADRTRYARRRLEDSRALLAEGRLEHAESNLRRGIAMVPEDPDLHRELARLLEDTNRSDEAQSHRRRADAVDPFVRLPDQPIAGSSHGLVVVLVATDPSVPFSRRQAPSSHLAADSLRDRLRVRMPDAMFVESDPETVADARRFLPQYAPRAVISLRLDRSYCARSIKDGPFAVAWLRVAAQVPGRPTTPASTVRAVVSGPAPACEKLAIERALELVLDENVVRAAIATPARGEHTTAEHYAMQPWSHDAVRELFPGIGIRITEEIEVGRVRLAGGDIGSAADAFRRAVHFDPADPYSRAYLREAEITLAMLQELAKRKSARMGISDFDAHSVDPRLSQLQIATAEARLSEEQRRRDDLLAALAVLDEDLEMPPERLLATLRTTVIPDPDSFGVIQAQRRAGGEVVARAAYAPSGGVLARYYYAEPGVGLPLVREEDTNGDTQPDRWIGYRGTHRAEIWEDSQGRGWPDRHFVFAKGGSPLIRIEIDEDANDDPERVFHYDDGVLTADDRDTDGDGTIDRFDRFDANGLVSERAEDLNGDGKIDIRDVYRDGKLVRRQIDDPEVVSRTRPDDAPPIN